MFKNKKDETDVETDIETDVETDGETDGEFDLLKEHIMHVVNCNHVLTTNKFDKKGGIINDVIGCGIQSLIYLGIINYKDGVKIIDNMDKGKEEWGTSFEKLLKYISVVSNSNFYEKNFSITNKEQMTECMEFINNGLDNNECTIVRYNRLSDDSERDEMCGELLSAGHSAVISKSNDKLIYIDPQTGKRVERFNDEKFFKIFQDRGCYVGISIAVVESHEKVVAQIDTLSEEKLEDSLKLLSNKNELERVRYLQYIHTITSKFQNYSFLKKYKTRDLIEYYQILIAAYFSLKIPDEIIKNKIKTSLINIIKKLKNRDNQWWLINRKRVPKYILDSLNRLGGKKIKKINNTNKKIKYTYKKKKTYKKKTNKKKTYKKKNNKNKRPTKKRR